MKSEVETWSIPPALVLKRDQTGSKLVPLSDRTIEKEGTKQVPERKTKGKSQFCHQFRSFSSFSSHLPGRLLPFQVIYQGKTAGCRAKMTFPIDWNITQSDSHWSTEQTMLEYR